MGAQLGPFDPGLGSALLGHLHPAALASSQRGGLVQEERFKKKKKKKKDSLAETWMDLETIMQSEVSQKEKN